MDAEQFRKAAHAAVEDVITYFDSLPDRSPLPSISPGYLRPQLPTNAPETGEEWPSIQADVSKLIEPGLTHWQSPHFSAFFPASATYPSLLGELYSAAFTAPAFNWLCSPACTELETVVLDWMGRAMHLPKGFLADESKGVGGGVIQGSASEAVVTVMVAARERYLLERTSNISDEKKRQDEIDRLRGKLVALGSEQAHSSTHKAANICGTRHRAVPALAKDGFAMTGEGLKKVLKECEEEGLEPFYLTVGLGTTATCSTDRFEEISEVLREWKMGRLWVHVDAAYAGAVLLLDEYKHYAAQMENFDSYNVNMHKWMLVNFDASMLYVRKSTDLTSALSISRSYLSNSYTDSGLVTDYRDWQIPLGRRFRALKIWFVLRSYGLSGLRAHVAKGIKFGEKFAEMARSRPDVLEVITGPTFGLTVVSVLPAPAVNGETKDLTKGNDITKAVYDRIFESGEVFLTSGVVDGIYAIRVHLCNERSELEHVQRMFDLIVRTAETIRAEGK